MLALDRLDSEEIRRYLTAQGVPAAGAPVTVEPLGGGVSNIVLQVTAPGRCLVLKQALPELRVEAYWPSRVDRALREAEALRVVSGYLPAGAVPDVSFIDDENFIYGMSCAPAGSRLWKEDLLAGVVDVPVAAAAGRLLAQMHAIQEPAVRQRFIDDEVFWQLRVDPYYNTVAKAHPPVKAVVESAIARMKERKLALVHGDYSPKNMFVLANEFAPSAGAQSEEASLGLECDKEKMDSRLRGNDGESAEMDSRPRGNAGGEASAADFQNERKTTSRNPVLLLDFEVVHWGDPAFDLAFCINHLLIKSIVNNHIQAEYFAAVSALLEGYRGASSEVNWSELEAETRLQLGCLMLARIDGKSPVEYIADEQTKDIVRRVSLSILHEQPATMAEVFAAIVKEKRS